MQPCSAGPGQLKRTELASEGRHVVGRPLALTTRRMTEARIVRRRAAVALVVGDS